MDLNLTPYASTFPSRGVFLLRCGEQLPHGLDVAYDTPGLCYDKTQVRSCFKLFMFIRVISVLMRVQCLLPVWKRCHWLPFTYGRRGQVSCPINTFGERGNSWQCMPRGSAQQVRLQCAHPEK